MDELSLSLLVKLGSLVVHLQEWDEGNGAQGDWDAVCALVDDQEIADWLATFGPALLPEKR